MDLIPTTLANHGSPASDLNWEHAQPCFNIGITSKHGMRLTFSIQTPASGSGFQMITVLSIEADNKHIGWWRTPSESLHVLYVSQHENYFWTLSCLMNILVTYPLENVWLKRKVREAIKIKIGQPAMNRDQGYELPSSMVNYCCHVIVVKAVT